MAILGHQAQQARRGQKKIAHYNYLLFNNFIRKRRHMGKTSAQNWHIKTETMARTILILC
jgi:hypothetical protein